MGNYEASSAAVSLLVNLYWTNAELCDIASQCSSLEAADGNPAMAGAYQWRELDWMGELGGLSVD